MVGSFSQLLLGDLRVERANCLRLDIASGAGVSFRTSRQPMFHLVLTGSAVIRLAGSEEDIRLSAGDFAFLMFGDGHTICALPGGSLPGPVQAVSIADELHLQEAPEIRKIGQGESSLRLLSGSLQFAYLSPSAFAIRAIPNVWVPADGDGSREEARSLLGDLQRIEEVCQGPGGTAFVTALLNLLVIQAFRINYKEVWHGQPVDVRAPHVRRIAAAVRAIHAHPEKRWSVAALGREVGVSRSTFAALFRASFGATPIAYITSVRMERAAALLEVQSMPLREVANRVGYPVESSFARVFRRHYGLSPGAYAAGRRSVKAAG